MINCPIALGPIVKQHSMAENMWQRKAADLMTGSQKRERRDRKDLTVLKDVPMV